MGISASATLVEGSVVASGTPASAAVEENRANDDDDDLVANGAKAVVEPIATAATVVTIQDNFMILQKEKVCR